MNEVLESYAYGQFIDGRDAGVISNTEEEIVEILQSQESVTYQNSRLTFTFTIDDLIEV